MLRLSSIARQWEAWLQSQKPVPIVDGTVKRCLTVNKLSIKCHFMVTAVKKHSTVRRPHHGYLSCLIPISDSCGSGLHWPMGRIGK
jgi:hypothetical protein